MSFLSSPQRRLIRETDEQNRAVERMRTFGGGTEGDVQWVASQVRSGRLPLENVRAAAVIGDPIARAYVGIDANDTNYHNTPIINLFRTTNDPILGRSIADHIMAHLLVVLSDRELRTARDLMAIRTELRQENIDWGRIAMILRELSQDIPVQPAHNNLIHILADVIWDRTVVHRVQDLLHVIANNNPRIIPTVDFRSMLIHDIMHRPLVVV